MIREICYLSGILQEKLLTPWQRAKKSEMSFVVFGEIIQTGITMKLHRYIKSIYLLHNNKIKITFLC